MNAYPPKLNLNRLTLPQRKYLLRLSGEGEFKEGRDVAWMIGTREQLLKRKMIEWYDLDSENQAIRMTARGKEAIESAGTNW